MNPESVKKYRPYPLIDLPDRTWPSKAITKAPVWCSVDLRDGNQALIQPMSLDKKLEMFRLLTDIGFKEIEVGFPSASQVEYEFTRTLIDNGLIPEGVLIQVLTQAREHLIRKTFESLKGAREAVVHLYNSTSTLQRKAVFKMNRKEIIALAVEGARLMKEEALKLPGDAFSLRIFPREFYRHRTGFRPGNLRGRSRCLAADSRESGHPQSAGDGRDGHAQYLCRPDRVVLPGPLPSRLRYHESACP